MKKTNHLFWLAIPLTVSALLTGCEQPGEALTTRKQRENEAEILTYISQNNINATKTDQGVWFFRIKANPTGQTPLTGDEVRYHYVARRLDGVVVDSTNTLSDIPASVILASGNTTGITLGKYAAILQLKQGETGSVLVPASLDGGRVGSLLLPQYSPVRYDVRIVSVRTEKQQIENYIRTNNLIVTTLTSDSIRVIKTLTQPTDSAAVAVGKTIKVNYTGYRLDGSTFDGTYAATSRDLQIGAQGVVLPGLENGLKTLRAGEKATIIFPSLLGYGNIGSRAQNGAIIIAPYSPIRYDVQVFSVK
ncbi:MAG: FKBP-type peptidyl-prolyl cis-trans isomerase [Spirosoma sp.]|nr:FKBP-type peptidyl-prolyl cis-trans isomerase [Spirosoma sp.]